MADTVQSRLETLMKEVESTHLPLGEKLALKAEILTALAHMAVQNRIANALAHLGTYGATVTLKTDSLSLPKVGLKFDGPVRVKLDGGSPYENPIRLKILTPPTPTVPEDDHDGS